MYFDASEPYGREKIMCRYSRTEVVCLHMEVRAAHPGIIALWPDMTCITSAMHRLALYCLVIPYLKVCMHVHIYFVHDGQYFCGFVMHFYESSVIVFVIAVLVHEKKAKPTGSVAGFVQFSRRFSSHVLVAFGCPGRLCQESP